MWGLDIEFIIGSVLIAGLGILIPNRLTAVRDRYERLRESRTAFSQAKTGVDYLVLRLCALSLEEAGKALRDIHVWKHQAELYSELENHLANRGDPITPKQWAYLLFEQLHAVGKALEDNAASWNQLALDQRVTILRKAKRAGRKKWEAYTELDLSEIYDSEKRWRAMSSEAP